MVAGAEKVWGLGILHRTGVTNLTERTIKYLLAYRIATQPTAVMTSGNQTHAVLGAPLRSYMRKTIDVKGNVVMVREESDDLIATLEQENRQLHERNKRLMAELEGFAEANEHEAIADLRKKLDMADTDKFESFRMSVKALAKCFEKGNMGMLVADIGEKVSIMGINADMGEVLLMAAGVVAKLEEVLQDMGDEDRTIN